MAAAIPADTTAPAAPAAAVVVAAVVVAAAVDTEDVPGLQRMAVQTPAVQDLPVDVDGDHFEQLLPVCLLTARRAFATFLP
jgi:hypothetical protein